MPEPLISIIITCYNDFLYIDQAIDSAINQNYKYKEVILVDDGSGEETQRVLDNEKGKLDKLILQENKGLSAARNIGIEAASGDFIVVLDGDDYFAPSFCQKALKLFSEENPLVKIVTCQARRFNDKRTIDIFTPSGGDISNFLLSNSSIGNAMFTKKDWQKTGGYDEKMLKGYEDWEFYIRLLKYGGKASVIQEPLFNYRQKRSSMRLNANKIKYDLWEYIFIKHSDLYKENFTAFTKFLLEKLREEEREKIKNTKRIDFILGEKVLRPIRAIKSIFK